MDIRTEEQLPGCWVAYDYDTYDGPPSPCGSGFSEQAAIDDLMEQLENRNERRRQQQAIRAASCLSGLRGTVHARGDASRQTIHGPNAVSVLPQREYNSCDAGAPSLTRLIGNVSAEVRENVMNHKPGPWTALPPAEWAGSDDQWKVPGVALCGNGELSEGNARLIAAAPDLLTALEELLRYWDEDEMDTDARIRIKNRAQATVNRATRGGGK